MTTGSRLDRLARAAERLRRSVLEAGVLEAGVLETGVLDDGVATTEAERRAACLGEVSDPALAGYVAAVREHVHRITDAHVAALREHGLSEDAVFELTVAAALGAAQQRLDAGLAVLDLDERR